MTGCEKCMNVSQTQVFQDTTLTHRCTRCRPELLTHTLEISPNPDFPWDHKRWYGECSCHNPDGLGVGRMDFTGDTVEDIRDLHEEHLEALGEEVST